MVATQVWNQFHKLICLYNAMLITRTIPAQDILGYTLYCKIFNHDLFHIVSEASVIGNSLSFVQLAQICGDVNVIKTHLSCSTLII